MKNRVAWIEPISQSQSGITWRWACSCGKINIEESVPPRGEVPDKIIPASMNCASCEQIYLSDPSLGEINFGLDVLLE